MSADGQVGKGSPLETRWHCQDCGNNGAPRESTEIPCLRGAGPALALARGMANGHAKAGANTHANTRGNTGAGLGTDRAHHDAPATSGAGPHGTVVVVGGSGGMTERYREVLAERGLEMRHFENRVPNGTRRLLGK